MSTVIPVIALPQEAARSGASGAPVTPGVRETRSTCPYCGVGCGVIIESTGTQITGVRGDPAHPANFGRLCTKGSTLHLTATDTVTRQARLLQPQWRPRRDDAPQPLDWDTAMAMAADRFLRTIQDHGPDAVGFYLSGQLLTEDYYVFNKLAKGLVGTNNLDTNSRLCMSSAVAGYKATLGADAPPACYEDLDHADCVFITGSNMAWAHPILFRRLEDAKARRPQMKVIVCDPRRTDTAEFADLHLAIVPGTDVMLYQGLLHLMLAEGWTRPDYIAAHTTGFEALLPRLQTSTPEVVARTCGLREEDLRTTARWFATSPATLSLYCQGLNQSANGTAKNAALVHLHLATAQIGRPGAGPFSLTGQPNAMGGREVGGMANLLPAHRDLANPAHRAEVAALWGVPSVPATPGKTAVEMFEAAADGEIKALWIACTNPAQSLPDQATVRRALERAEFVVVQEAFATTATCGFADLLLPATTWGEKEGTVTNSERRISRVRPAVPAPGQARHDWRIALDLARRLEPALRPGLPTLFPYEGDSAPRQIWEEHRETTRGRDLDITGIRYEMLEAAPRQWPLPAREGASLPDEDAQGLPRLYADGCFPTADGRARFADLGWEPVAEPTGPSFPFALTTGRLRDQWHGMSRTGTLGRLFGHVPEPAVQMHPEDMARLHLAEGALVRVRSRRGAVVLPAQASDTVATGQAFIAMHWGSEFLGGRDAEGRPLAGVNALTTPAFCPRSKQPELKHTAVAIELAHLPWGLCAMAWLPADGALAVLERLRALMPRFDFANCVPFGREGGGVLLRAASREPAPAEVLAEVEALLELSHPAGEVMRYTDPARGQGRAVRLSVPAAGGSDAHLQAFLLAGDTRSASWLQPLLQQRQPARAYGRLLLRPGAEPPVAMAARGRQVCTCFNVDEEVIGAHLAACAGTPEARLASLQGALKCGTNCGSCVPELKRLVRQAPVPAAA